MGYNKLGDLDQAISKYEEAEKLLAHHNNTDELMRAVYSNLGNLHLSIRVSVYYEFTTHLYSVYWQLMFASKENGLNPPCSVKYEW